jgi:hypothetical protein
MMQTIENHCPHCRTRLEECDEDFWCSHCRCLVLRAGYAPVLPLRPDIALPGLGRHAVVRGPSRFRRASLRRAGGAAGAQGGPLAPSSPVGDADQPNNVVNNVNGITAFDNVQDSTHGECIGRDLLFLPDDE